MTFVVEIKEAGRTEGYDKADCDESALAQTGKTLSQLLCEYCDPQDTEAQDTLLDVYESCRPSEGYLALYINGAKVTGNVKKDDTCDELPLDACLVEGDSETPVPTERTLPWTYGQSTFEGVTTRFQDCPNYLKIGHYALGYQYNAIATASQGWSNPSDVPTLDTEFDFVRIASTRRLAENTSIAEATPKK